MARRHTVRSTDHHPARPAGLDTAAPPSPEPLGPGRASNEAGEADDAGLRRRCEDLIADLDVPEPFDLDVFCAMLGARRGRPIALRPSPVPMGRHCGLTLRLAEMDWVLYEPDTTAFHRRHIIFHEIGHLMCGHPGDPRLTVELLRLIAPTLDPDVMAGMLGASGTCGRGRYTTGEERAAEMFASLLLQRVDRPPEPRWTAPADEVLARIERSLARPDRGR